MIGTYNGESEVLSLNLLLDIEKGDLEFVAYLVVMCCYF